jgi:hypothetical protein
MLYLSLSDFRRVLSVLVVRRLFGSQCFLSKGVDEYGIHLSKRWNHWSDESQFLLHVTDGRTRVWRQKNTAYTPRNIQLTVPYGGGSVIVWVYLS